MPLTDDDTIFAPLARAFAVRYVASLARVLHRHPGTAFDLTALDATAGDLLFDLCFFGAAQYEAQSGLDRGGRRYLPRPVFEIDGTTAPDILLGKTVIHGLFDDDLLAEGIAQAQAMLRDF